MNYGQTRFHEIWDKDAAADYLYCNSPMAPTSAYSAIEEHLPVTKKSTIKMTS